MIIEAETYEFLEHHGVKGMHWGVRTETPKKNLPLSKRSGRVQKRVQNQQQNLDQMRRVASGKASVGDKFVVGLLRTTVGNLVMGGGLKKGTQLQLDQLQKEKKLVQAGKGKTVDLLKRSAGVNVRYLNYSY